MIHNLKEIKKSSKKFQLLFSGEYEIEESKLNSISYLAKEKSTWINEGDYYELTEWKNGEGYDMLIQDKNSGRQSFSIHFTQLEIFIKLLFEIGAIDADFFSDRIKIKKDANKKSNSVRRKY